MVFEFLKWLRLGILIKRWTLLMIIGIGVISLGVAQLFLLVEDLPVLSILTLSFLPPLLRMLVAFSIGIFLFLWGLRHFNRTIMYPFLPLNMVDNISDIYTLQRQLNRGKRVVAVGGGTGMPSVLRAMKTVTNNITAVVTVADDGGSSGRLRRELGVLPPGDLRNNLAALARDEDLMGQLLGFRFNTGDLNGHTFGNIFLAALMGTVGPLDKAAAAAGEVLAIQGKVLPCTLADLTLVAHTRQNGNGEVVRVEGESQIPKPGWKIQQVFLEPDNAYVLPQVDDVIRSSDLIVIGPGSIYTSILPTLLVNGVIESIRESEAVCVYICNIATQPGETEGFDVADHVAALEKHVGKGIFQAVIANNHYPEENAGPNTIYVKPAPANHPIRQRYRLIEADLTDDQRPWRHDPAKLRRELLKLLYPNQRIAQYRI